MKKELCYLKANSPIGPLYLVANSKGLCAIRWGSEKPNKIWVKKQNHPILKETKKQLEEYFKGQRQKFDLPLSVEGTEFQKKSWKALQRIPYGKAISYQKQAKMLGDPNRARAVGTANSKNQIPIVIPCHRVISKSGQLGGFTGGVEIKRELLKLEKA